MRIRQKQGRYGLEDKLILVTTDKEDEPVTITKLCFLVNFLAINESKRWKKYLPSSLFEDIICDAIEKGKEGINLVEWLGIPKNRRDWCYKHKMMNYYDKTKEEILKETHLTLEGFENGST